MTETEIVNEILFCFQVHTVPYMMISEMQLQRVHQANLLGLHNNALKPISFLSPILEMPKTYIDHGR